MNLPLEQSRPHFNGILLKLRFRRENRANASVTQAKGAVTVQTLFRWKELTTQERGRSRACLCLTNFDKFFMNPLG